MVRVYVRRFLSVIVAVAVKMGGVEGRSADIVQNHGWIFSPGRWKYTSFSEERTTTQEPRTNACQRRVSRGTFLGQSLIGFTVGFGCHPGQKLLDLSTEFVRQHGQPILASPFSLSLARDTRGGSQVLTKNPRPARSSSSKDDKESNKDKKKSHHKSPLSASIPFFPVEALGGLTLAEIGKSFEYAVHSTRDGFNQEQFLAGLRKEVKAMLDAMDKAASTSRGKNVHKVITGLEKTGGIDVFEFCAAARILSEWRLVRQVPEGYKRYSVSMKMGHKDIVQNIGKIEDSAHGWIDSQKEKQSDKATIFSPTIRDLLQYETDMNYHPQLPRLKEASGAMGLLWVRRQLDFQTTVFEKLLEIPQNIPSSVEAFNDAYKHIYSRYHGAAVKKVFTYSLNRAPEIHQVYNCMNPRRLKEIQESLGAEKLSIPEETIMQDMEKDAHENIRVFVDKVRPLIDDVGTLITEFNMNDPKKV